MGKPKRDPNSVKDMQYTLKDIFEPMFESMLKGEMNPHLGYKSMTSGKRIKELKIFMVSPFLMK